MTTYNTRNPLGSSHPKDLYDNAENLDRALNAAGDTWIDRLGVVRPTVAGALKQGTAHSYSTLSAMNADSSKPNGTWAVVVNDSPANNGFYIRGGGGWEKSTLQPVVSAEIDRNNSAFVPMLRDGGLSPYPSYLAKAILSVKVTGARPGKVYALVEFSNGYKHPAEEMPSDFFIIWEQNEDFTEMRQITYRAQKIEIDRSLKTQSVRVYGYHDPSIYFDILLAPGLFANYGIRMSQGSNYSWVIGPENYFDNPQVFYSALDRINRTVYENDLIRLREALADPLHSVRIKLIGDSITWGSGATGRAPTEPRSQSLTDPRNNYTSRSWANILRDVLGHIYLNNPSLIQEDTDYHSSPDFSGYAYYAADVLVDPIQSPSVEFIPDGGVEPINKDSLRKASRGPATYGYTVEISDSRNSNSRVKVSCTTDNLTVVFTSTTSEEQPDCVVDVFDDETRELLSSFNYTGRFGNKQEELITFPFGKRVLSFEVRSGATVVFELEAFKMEKRVSVNNDGINGTHSQRWCDVLLEQSIDQNDEFVFVQLGTNDRNRAPVNNKSGIHSFTKNMEEIVTRIKEKTGFFPILMCANAVTNPEPTQAYGFTMSEVYAVLRALAARKNLTLIDNFSLTGYMRALSKPYTSDGLHPNDAGYEAIAKNILEKITSLSLD